MAREVHVHYVVVRESDGVVRAKRVAPGLGNIRDLDPRYDLRNHSPDGFNYGYSGSGPAQLALAMVSDAVGDDEITQLAYQKFKSRVISGQKDDRFILSRGYVREVVLSILEESNRGVTAVMLREKWRM